MLTPADAAAVADAMAAMPPPEKTVIREQNISMVLSVAFIVVGIVITTAVFNLTKSNTSSQGTKAEDETKYSDSEEESDKEEYTDAHHFSDS